MIVIVVGVFFELQRMYPNIDIWVSFSMGKHFDNYQINLICHSLGEERCRGLPFYHSFTGCDTTSQFVGKGKRSSWGAWSTHSAVTKAFQYAAEHPFKILNIESPEFELLECFTCVLYDKTTLTCKVNILRQELFSHSQVNGKHPTNSGLLQYTNEFITIFIIISYMYRQLLSSILTELFTKPVYGQLTSYPSKTAQLKDLDGCFKEASVDTPSRNC